MLLNLLGPISLIIPFANRAKCSRPSGIHPSQCRGAAAGFSTFNGENSGIDGTMSEVHTGIAVNCKQPAAGMARSRLAKPNNRAMLISGDWPSQAAVDRQRSTRVRAKLRPPRLVQGAARFTISVHVQSWRPVDKMCLMTRPGLAVHGYKVLSRLEYFRSLQSPSSISVVFAQG